MLRVSCCGTLRVFRSKNHEKEKKCFSFAFTTHSYATGLNKTGKVVGRFSLSSKAVYAFLLSDGAVEDRNPALRKVLCDAGRDRGDAVSVYEG